MKNLKFTSVKEVSFGLNEEGRGGNNFVKMISSVGQVKMVEGVDGEIHEFRFNIQNVVPEVLLGMLNASEGVDEAVPKQEDTLQMVSPTTRRLIDLVDERLTQRRIAFLAGPTGVGKTTLIKTLAFENSMPVYQETGAETTTYAQLTTSMRFRNTENGRETVMVPAGLIRAAMVGAIYQIDEFNYLSGDVQLAIAQIVDENEILLSNGVRVPVHEDFAIVCTGNIGYGGTNRVNDAVLRRAGGIIEVGYLPEKEEIDSVDADFRAKIKQMNTARGLNISSDVLSKEEVAKVVICLRAIRNKLEEEYRKKIHELSRRRNVAQAIRNVLPSMEDFVSYHEQFSFRKISEFIQSAVVFANMQLKNEILYQEVFNFTFLDSFNAMDEASSVVAAQLLGKSMKFDLSPLSLQNILSRKFTDLQFFTGDFDKKQSKIEIRNTDVGFNERGVKTNFDFDSSPGKFLKVPGRELNTVPAVRDFVAKVTDEIVQHPNSSRSQEVLVFKDVIGFQYGDKKGYALLAWKGLTQDAVAYDQLFGQFFIQNKDRIGSYIQIYWKDDGGKVMINPDTGTICSFDKNGVVPKGFERVSTEFKEGMDRRKIKEIVVSHIKQTMIHADTSLQSAVKQGDAMRTFTAEMLPSVEGGKSMSRPLTPETAGRYFDYKTPTIEKNLGLINQRHLLGGNILLTGPSGTGKTSYAKTYAIEHKLPYVASQFHERVTEGEILKRVTLRNGNVVEAPLPLIMAFKHGWVAELREINLAMPQLIPFINTLLDKNGEFFLNNELIRRHLNFLPIATRNPFSEIYSGTKPMPSSFLNRFTPLTIDYPNPSEECAMLMSIVREENVDLLMDFGVSNICATGLRATTQDIENRKNRGEVKLMNVIDKMLPLINNTRKRLIDPEFLKSSSVPVQQLLQKQRWSTDLLQDLVRNAKTRTQFTEIFMSKYRLSHEETSLLSGNNIHDTLILAQINHFLM